LQLSKLEGSGIEIAKSFLLWGYPSNAG
jgi:hypothetical protein